MTEFNGASMTEFNRQGHAPRKLAMGENMTDQQIGRLAMRHEGTMWNAYYALPHSMDGAIFLGSIAIRFVEDNGRKDAFLAFMREAVADLIEEKTGRRPTWPDGPQLAPEHERGGHT